MMFKMHTVFPARCCLELDIGITEMCHAVLLVVFPFRDSSNTWIFKLELDRHHEYNVYIIYPLVNSHRHHRP